MFNQKKEGFDGTTVIAEGVRVQGEFYGDSPMVIDGIVHGSVSTPKSIEVGSSAEIEADVKAGSMIVGGRIKGNVIAHDRLELLSGGRIDGDVVTRSLIVAEGAILNGRCTMNPTTAQELIEDIQTPKPKPSRERLA